MSEIMKEKIAVKGLSRLELSMTISDRSQGGLRESQGVSGRNRQSGCSCLFASCLCLCLKSPSSFFLPQTHIFFSKYLKKDVVIKLICSLCGSFFLWVRLWECM